MDRNTLLKRRELPREKVTVPEWGEVHVRMLSGAERDEYEQDFIEAKQEAAKTGSHMPNVRARLLVRTLCNEKGERLLNAEDAEELGKQPAAALQAAYDVAVRLNAVSKADQEELEKN